jgi:hypothetical protein
MIYRGGCEEICLRQKSGRVGVGQRDLRNQDR